MYVGDREQNMYLGLIVSTEVTYTIPEIFEFEEIFVIEN
jgi:hypothetical protein